MQLLYEEMAFIACHFHWSHGELMQLDHRERRRWCNEISAINRKLDSSSSRATEVSLLDIDQFGIKRKQG